MTMNYTSYCAGMGCFHPIRPGEVLQVKQKNMWDDFPEDDYDVEVDEDDDYDLKEEDE